jgi:60 kDa SS-A/Ro ribonucleoprotein
MDALDKAFYKAFVNVRPTGKRHLIGIDVSHSMSAKIMNSAVQCNVAAGALALVTASVEPRTHIMMFDRGMWPADITPRDRLDSAVRKVSNINGGGTDCSLPMLYALEKGLAVDAFVVLTDNETWAGRCHPVQALKQYRQKTGIPAKLVVVGMTATGFSIADPDDAGMLDVVGFDAGAPVAMADFIR